MKHLENIKVGDMVTVRTGGSFSNPRQTDRIAAVTKVTKTQLMAAGHIFRKDNGRAIPKYNSARIVESQQ